MKNTGFRIVKDFSRLPKEVLEKFRHIPISVIGDSMNRTAAISSDLFAVSKSRLLGSAYTVRVRGGDNLLFYYAIAQAKAGDVIVVDGDGFSERALCGEIMAQLAKKRGIAGFVVYGAIRDKQEIAEMDYPVYACATTPNGPYKNGPGEINVPVNIGGRVVCPGDIIVGDISGLVVIKPKDAEAVWHKSQEIIKKEAAMLEQIDIQGSLNLDWVYKKLDELQCEFIAEASYDNYI